MRLVVFLSVFALVAGVSINAAGQVRTAEELAKTMRRIGPAQQAASKAIQAMVYVDARKQLEIIETGLTDAQNFWIVKKREDATKFTRETLAKIENLEKLLDAKAPDQAAITAAYREVGVACAACHRVYRTTDDNNKFILKPGTVD